MVNKDFIRGLKDKEEYLVGHRHQDKTNKRNSPEGQKPSWPYEKRTSSCMNNKAHKTTKVKTPQPTLLFFVWEHSVIENLEQFIGITKCFHSEMIHGTLQSIPRYIRLACQSKKSFPISRAVHRDSALTTPPRHPLTTVIFLFPSARNNTRQYSCLRNCFQVNGREYVKI